MWLSTCVITKVLSDNDPQHSVNMDIVIVVYEFASYRLRDSKVISGSYPYDWRIAPIVESDSRGDSGMDETRRDIDDAGRAATVTSTLIKADCKTIVRPTLWGWWVCVVPSLWGSCTTTTNMYICMCMRMYAHTYNNAYHFHKSTFSLTLSLNCNYTSSTARLDRTSWVEEKSDRMIESSRNATDYCGCVYAIITIMITHCCVAIAVNVVVFAFVVVIGLAVMATMCERFAIGL